MKYTRIIAGQTGPVGSHGILKGETIYLLDQSLFLGPVKEAGVGFARKPPVFLKPGDRIEVEIEGIGTLKNPVVGEK